MLMPHEWQKQRIVLWALFESKDRDEPSPSTSHEPNRVPGFTSIVLALPVPAITPPPRDASF